MMRSLDVLHYGLTGSKATGSDADTVSAILGAIFCRDGTPPGKTTTTDTVTDMDTEDADAILNLIEYYR